MSDPGHKSVYNNNYEVVGNAPARQLNIWFRMKTSVLGNFDTGPGLKNLLTLLFFHKLGKPVFWLRTWLSNQHGLKLHGVKQHVKALIPGLGK